VSGAGCRVSLAARVPASTWLRLELAVAPLPSASWQNGPTAGTTANRTRIGQSGARTAVLSTAGKVHGR